jgi:OPT oligopeptide transporter protein
MKRPQPTDFFLELFLQWRMLFFAFKALARALTNFIYDVGLKFGKDLKFLKMKPQDESNMIQDPAHPSELPAMWMWGGGLILTIVGMIVVMSVQFQMPVSLTLLSLFLAFFFSFLAIQCTGVAGKQLLTLKISNIF